MSKSFANFFFIFVRKIVYIKQIDVSLQSNIFFFMKKSFFLLIGNFLCLIHAFGYTLNTLPQCLHMIEGDKRE